MRLVIDVVIRHWVVGRERVFGLGNTPLHLAMESGYGEAAALLIEAGADRTRVNTNHFNFASF